MVQPDLVATTSTRLPVTPVMATMPEVVVLVAPLAIMGGVAVSKYETLALGWSFTLMATPLRSLHAPVAAESALSLTRIAGSPEPQLEMKPLKSAGNSTRLMSVESASAIDWPTMAG